MKTMDSRCNHRAAPRALSGPQAPAGPRLRRWLAMAGALLLSACATPAARVGVPSPLAQLGAPVMVATTLGKLAVWDTGARPGDTTPPVLLWPSIFTDHVIYSSLVERWRGKRRLILVDGPGHGASEGPAGRRFTMQECAHAMKAVLDARGVSAAVVGGTSWGGLVGGEFALLYPQHTRGVVMMNTPFFVTPGGPSMGEKFITFGSRWTLWTGIFTGGVARSFFMPGTRDAGGPVMTHFHQALHEADAGALSNAIASVLLERIALADRLPRIEAPALVVAGEHDEMYPLALQRDAVARLARGTFVVVESRHISVVDQPTAVARALEQFLAALPPAAP